MKIVVIGAGSKDFGRGQVADIMAATELKGRGVVLTLVDLNEKALADMARFAEMAREHTGSDITIETETDRRKALPGADYVITSVARYRYELWEQDYRVPMAHGFRHILGENGGPGALFHALRSFELVIPICRDVEELAPDATLLNFTNPEARVLHAICHLTKVHAYGICHGVFSGLGLASRCLNRPVEELDIISAGMNHFYCVMQVKDRKTGEDLLPEVKKRAVEDDAVRKNPLVAKMLEIFDMLTYNSDDHIGEYLNYGADFCDCKWPYGREVKPVRLSGPDAPGRPTVTDCLEGRVAIGDMLAPSGEITIPMICDIELGREAVRPAVNVVNEPRYIENLSPTGVVEVPARVDADGIHPMSVGPLPEPVAAMIRIQHSIHDLLTEAWRTRSKNLLLQALLLDPVVNSVREAEKLLDEMLELQKDFLPEF